MPFYTDRDIHTRNTQSHYSHAPPVIRQKEPAFSTGSETNEYNESVPNQMITKLWDKDLMKEVEDFVESIRREVIQKEARRVPTTTSTKRPPASPYTDPNGRMATVDADVVNCRAQERPKCLLTSSHRGIFWPFSTQR